MRQWAGIVDVVLGLQPDHRPRAGQGLYLNCGWGTGGFKAIPAGGYVLAHLLATGRIMSFPRPSLFAASTTGALIDEAAGAGISH